MNRPADHAADTISHIIPSYSMGNNQVESAFIVLYTVLSHASEFQLKSQGGNLRLWRMVFLGPTMSQGGALWWIMQ